MLLDGRDTVLPWGLCWPCPVRSGHRPGLLPRTLTLPPNVPLPAPEAVKRFTLPAGFTITLFAAEPDIVQPIAMTIDPKGRLWVVENYSYPIWLGGPRGQGPDLDFRRRRSRRPVRSPDASFTITGLISPASSSALAACGCAPRRTCFSFPTETAMTGPTPNPSSSSTAGTQKRSITCSTD